VLEGMFDHVFDWFCNFGTALKGEDMWLWKNVGICVSGGTSGPCMVFVFGLTVTYF
jgi:hypothetical protein